MRTLILTVLLLLPVTAAALDCTPFQSWTCTQQGYFGLQNGQPGEVICGVDYTGWTLHVVDVTVTQGGWVDVAATAGTGPGALVTTVVMLMDDCAAGTCVASQQSSGVSQLDVCLDVGTHTFVIATQTTAPSAVINMGLACLTCEQAAGIGLTGCAACDPVGDESVNWGTFKVRYQ